MTWGHKSAWLLKARVASPRHRATREMARHENGRGGGRSYLWRGKEWMEGQEGNRTRGISPSLSHGFGAGTQGSEPVGFERRNSGSVVSGAVSAPARGAREAHLRHAMPAVER